jgi:hypothetical protein
LKLKAPIGRTGLVMCSASGTNAQIDADGNVEVSLVDLPDLLRAGFSVGDERLPVPLPAASTFVQDAAPPAAPAGDSVPAAPAGTPAAE